MRRVIGSDGKEGYFNSRLYDVGEWYEFLNGTWYIVTGVRESEAVDEYGEVDRGWSHTLREATKEEIAEREKAQAKWDAKPADERVSETLRGLSEELPGLDWGDTDFFS